MGGLESKEGSLPNHPMAVPSINPTAGTPRNRKKGEDAAPVPGKNLGLGTQIVSRVYLSVFPPTSCSPFTNERPDSQT